MTAVTNASSSRTRGTLARALFLLLARSSLFFGCTGSDELGVRPDLDPQLLLVDYASPRQRFDGRGGSLLLGAGWGFPVEQPSEPSGYSAWALHGSSDLSFMRPPEPKLDFYARCIPFTYPSAPPQGMTLVLNDRRIARVELLDQWQEVRIPLPAEALLPGLNRMRLVFDHAVRPKDVGYNDDVRPLSASFSEIAILPRFVEEPRRFLSASSLDVEAGRLELPVGGGSAFPLPPHASGTLRLGRIETECAECRLRVRVLDGAFGVQEIWTGPAQRAGEKLIRFETRARGFSRLVLEAVARDDVMDGALSSATVELSLPQGFLSLTLRPRPVSRPHVFLYVVDTLRADVLEPYGGDPRVSPRLSEFARDAVTYSRAWAASTWTLPSVVSTLTGVYPLRHGMLTGSEKLTDGNLPTLQELLARMGYETFAVSQSYVVGPEFGIDTGFDTFILDDHLNRRHLRSQEVRGYVHQWLVTRSSEGSVFAYVHTVGPHAPYSPHDRFLGFAEEIPKARLPERHSAQALHREGLQENPRAIAHLKALYAGEVQYADAEFGRFLDMLEALGMYEDSLIVFVSDHGEEFGEHGGFSHGRTLYEELLHVPLIVKFPRSQWAGARVADRVSAVDLVPTILDALQIDVTTTELHGRSILPSRLETRRDKERFVFAEVSPSPAEIFAAVDLRAIALEDHKCIESLNGVDQFHGSMPRWQCFDLASDPAESAPLPEDHSRATESRETLTRWLERQPRTESEVGLPTDDEALERLRALGYVK